MSSPSSKTCNVSYGSFFCNKLKEIKRKQAVRNR